MSSSSGSPRSWQNLSNSYMCDGFPAMCTNATASMRSATSASRAGAMFSESSMSTSTGSCPHHFAALYKVGNCKAGIAIRDPLGRSVIVSSSAEEPELTNRA